MPAPEVAFGIAGAQAGWLAASSAECWIVVTCVLQKFRNNCYGAFPMLCVCLLAPEQFFLWRVLTARTYVKSWTEESPHAVLQNTSICRLQVAVCSVYVTVCQDANRPVCPWGYACRCEQISLPLRTDSS